VKRGQDLPEMRFDESSDRILDRLRITGEGIEGAYIDPMTTPAERIGDFLNMGRCTDRALSDIAKIMEISDFHPFVPGLAALRSRRMSSHSSLEKYRVAIAAASAMRKPMIPSKKRFHP
jgi:hypothetical protein